MECDRVWRNARLATMQSADLGVIERGLVAARGDVIVYAGHEDEAPLLKASDTRDCEGRWVTPGLIDCHTHLVHAGDRAKEFELRLEGASYEEIARAGGGILSTMRATRAASEDDL
ncbi:MAG: imidazolonepropionase, partial [Hyphomicrobiales bacterium]